MISEELVQSFRCVGVLFAVHFLQMQKAFFITAFHQAVGHRFISINNENKKDLNDAHKSGSNPYDPP